MASRLLILNFVPVFSAWNPNPLQPLDLFNDGDDWLGDWEIPDRRINGLCKEFYGVLIRCLWLVSLPFFFYYYYFILYFWGKPIYYSKNKIYNCHTINQLTLILTKAFFERQPTSLITIHCHLIVPDFNFHIGTR